VRVIPAVPPAAPSAITVGGATSTTLVVGWTDNSTNESGFRITVTPAAGGAPLVFTTTANALSTTVTGLRPGTAYLVQVSSFNGVGTGAADAVPASTLALPVAPSAVSGAISATVSRGINVTFTDNSSDETSFQIQRATTAGGTYSTVATLNVVNPATTGALTVTDTSGPPNTAASYFYRVIAVRGPDSSVPSPVSAAVATPAAPTSNAAPTFGTVTATSVVVNWTRRNTTETGYIVFRAPVNGTTVGTFTAVSGVLGLATTFTDNSAAPNTTYRYRINAVGWASYDPGQNGVVSANVTTLISLAAPTSVAATSANSPVVTWVDQTAGETGYRVRRIPQTVNATTGVVTAGTPSANLLANNAGALAGTGLTGSFTDGGASRDTLYKYDVAALNGTTAGPATTSGFALAATAGLPTANRPTLTAGTGANAGRVTVTWTQPGGATSVGGYEVQRCTGATCTNFAKVNGTAVNTAGTVDGRNTLTFTDTGLVRGTTYTYRMRTVGGQGTGLLGGFSATRSVTAN
jgi:hypothetical protein